MRNLRPSPVPAVLSYCFLAGALAAQSQLIQGQTVLSEGDPCPGLPGVIIGGGGVLASPFPVAGLGDSPVVDLAGNLFFRARITGPGVTTNTTDRVYLRGRTRETLQLILRSGDADPTGQLGVGTIIGTATSTGLNGSPRVSPENNYLMFSVALSGPNIVNTGTAATGRNDSALLWGVPGGLLKVAQRGDSFTTPSNGLTYQHDSAFSLGQQTSSMNSFGRVCFQATVLGGDVTGTTNNVGWLTGTVGNLDWVQRKNDLVAIATGNNPGLYAINTALGFNCPMNIVGQILHDENLQRSGTPPAGASLATTANDSCLFIYTPGNGNALLMREGDQAAGMPAGVLYGPPTIAQGFGVLGKCAFSGTMTGTGVTLADDNAVFMGDLNSIQPVMREGDAPAALPAGVLMGTPNSASCYSDYQGGSLAFFCTVTGAGVTAFNDTSMWLGQPGNLKLIAREGDPAPGFENTPGYVSAVFGDTVGSGSGGISAGSVHLNDRGQMVFGLVTVTVNTIDPNTLLPVATVLTSCNYSWDPTTGLKLLYARNDVFPSTAYGPQPTFSIGGIQFPSGEGSTLSLTSDGDWATRVGYTNGNGHGSIVRCKIGALDGAPSALSATLGGLHTMKLDAGVAHAGELYVVIAGGSGTRPGFDFGGGHIPLNPDAVTQLSIDSLTAFPGTPWGTTLGLLDGNGRGTATFTMPAGFPQLAGMGLNHVMAVIDLGLNVHFVSPPTGALLY
jgi:hypothetical protein